jgi:hypothetical protein
LESQKFASQVEISLQAAISMMLAIGRGPVRAAKCCLFSAMKIMLFQSMGKERVSVSCDDSQKIQTADDANSD